MPTRCPLLLEGDDGQLSDKAHLSVSFDVAYTIHQQSSEPVYQIISVHILGMTQLWRARVKKKKKSTADGGESERQGKEKEEGTEARAGSLHLHSVVWLSFSNFFLYFSNLSRHKKQWKFCKRGEAFACRDDTSNNKYVWDRSVFH